MKTLTQITEDFKISQYTKNEPIRVVALHRSSTTSEANDNYSEHLIYEYNKVGLIYCDYKTQSLVKNYKYTFAGKLVKRGLSNWNSVDDIDAITKKHNWKRVDTISVFNLNSIVGTLFNVIITEFDDDDFKELKSYPYFSETVCVDYHTGQTNIKEKIESLIDKGYLNDIRT